MSALIRVENGMFEDFLKSQYKEIDELPLMSTPIYHALLVVAYLSFVLSIGPRLMKNRKPFDLRYFLIAYNAIQVIFSAYMFTRGFKFILDDGLLRTKCYVNDERHRNEVFVNIWIYYIAKVTELLDTVLFILRKKFSQVSLLHVYHHTLMMSAVWFYLKYTPYENVIFVGVLNSLVHVFMYTYYGLSAIGPHVAKYLTWKKYMTVIQLIQFVLIFVIYNLTLVYSDCPPPKTIASFIVFNNILMIFLFGDFYRKTYSKQGKEVVQKIKTQ